MTKLTGQNIVDLFNQDTGDTTELSPVAELQLANKIAGEIYSAGPDWEFLKKEATGIIAVDGNGIATITVPTDFNRFSVNGQATDIAIGVDNGAFGIGNASPKVIFVSATSGVYTPYQIVNFSDRRAVYNKRGYAWYDMVNNLITFALAPTASDLSYSFDYIYSPPAFTLLTYPALPSDFHDMVHHGMALDDMIFQLFDRSHSYQAENKAKFDDYMSRMRLWNAQFVNN